MREVVRWRVKIQVQRLLRFQLFGNGIQVPEQRYIRVCSEVRKVLPINKWVSDVRELLLDSKQHSSRECGAG